MAGGDADSSSPPSPPPNKRRKTLKSEENPIPDEPKNPSSPSPSESCAICYSDDAIRGKIDSCNHYFCFFCIKEWSKTSTLCPLCRRRFHNIHRPAKDGVYKRKWNFKVPVRDQVYIPIGNTVSFCTVCHGTQDDSLLLLCDACDSAAHTYCVGLGNNVPRGDWFCQDCTTDRGDQHTDAESEDEDILPASAFGYRMRIPRFTTQSSDITPPHIVPERCTNNANGVTTTERTLPSVSNRPTESAVRNIASEVSMSSRTLPSVSNRPTESVARSTGNAVTMPARIVLSVSNRQTESVARTLDRFRNVHTRIQAMREHWDGFRSGSLSFPSSSSKSSCISNQRYNNGVVIHERSADSGQTQSWPSTSCQKLENRDTSGSHDIEKAWKMMEMARSMQHANNNSSSAVQSKVPSSRTSDSRERAIGNSCVGTSGLVQSSYSTSGQRPTNKVGCGTHDLDNAWKIMDTIKSKQHVPRNTISSSSAVQHPIFLCTKSSASKEATNVYSSFDILRSQQLGAWDRGRTGMEACKSTSCGKETVRNQPVKLENGSACSMDEGASSSCYPKPELSTSSSSTLDVRERNIGWRDSCLESKARYDDAKSEIVSLVKSNLKRLSKDKLLGYDAFKEIARLSTHTILAACGLEHSKSCKYSFPSLVCSHSEQYQLHPKSNLMPKSCQACFHRFVEDVVSSILFHPVGSAKFR